MYSEKLSNEFTKASSPRGRYRHTLSLCVLQHINKILIAFTLIFPFCFVGFFFASQTNVHGCGCIVYQIHLLPKYKYKNHFSLVLRALLKFIQKQNYLRAVYLHTWGLPVATHFAFVFTFLGALASLPLLRNQERRRVHGVHR